MLIGILALAAMFVVACGNTVMPTTGFTPVPTDHATAPSEPTLFVTQTPIEKTAPPAPTPNPTATAVVTLSKPTINLTATPRAVSNLTSTPNPAISRIATSSPARAPRATVPPVVTSTLRFDFGSAILPSGDPNVYGILVDSTDEKLWYVSGQNGLYITRDGGNSWELNRVLAAKDTALAQDSNQVYAGVNANLYASADKGQNWNIIGKFDASTSIRSLLVGRDGTIYAGLHWANSGKPSSNSEGIYISHDRGVTWQLSSFASPYRGLIVWCISQDARDGTLYAGTEIYDHPQPYHPPFFRSRDDGKTWQDISGILDWHVLAVEVHPNNGYLYALTEGHGLYGSSDQGDHWNLLSGNISLTLLLDPNSPNRLFGSAFSNALKQFGGVFISTNGGTSFEQIGLAGMTTNALALNGTRPLLYAVVPGSGIYVSKIPLSAK